MLNPIQSFQIYQNVTSSHEQSTIETSDKNTQKQKVIDSFLQDDSVEISQSAMIDRGGDGWVPPE